MRFLVFLVAFVIGVALIAPLDRWLLPFLRDPLARAGVQLRVDSLRLALPAGFRAEGVGLENSGGSIDLDSLYVGLGRTFHAEACDGSVHGSVKGDAINVNLSGVNPSRCVHVGKLELESSFDGAVTIGGLDLARPRIDGATTASIDLASSGGVFRGVLPHAGKDGSDLPLGEWEFTDLVLHATLTDGEVAIQEGHTVTSGVEWQVTAATLPSGDPKSAVRVDFRARQLDDGPRARALIGLMPKAAQDGNGWHNYRVIGTLSSPRVIGVD